MHVLVTGATGLLGQQLVKTLSAKGHRVSGLYWAHPTYLVDQADVTYYRCDLRQEREVLSLFEQHEAHPEVIVHCAALTNVDRCEQDQSLAYAVNVLGTRHVLRASATVDARLIYVSTASVFSGQRGGYTEEDVPNPCNFYSLTKFLGEEITLTRHVNLVVRANILGIHPLRQETKNLAEWLIAMVRQNKDLKLFNDIKINPISNITLAEILAILLTYDGDQYILHVGSHDVVSKATVGRLVIEHFQGYSGQVQEVSIDELDLTAARPKEMWLDTRKVAQELHLQLPSVREEISRILCGVGLHKPTEPITA